MAYKSLTPMLRTKDLKGTVDFYSRLLGFNCNAFNEEWGWASLSKDSIELMIARPNDHTPFNKPQFTGSFYFNVDDVAALWDQLRNATTVCFLLEAFDYGMKEFAVFDNNGYLLQFGQPITR